MADPKFINLPGIARDQPDVYETPDVEEGNTSEYYEEEQVNECIERLHISTKDSAKKFKGKSLEGQVDFSDNILKRIRKGGYDAWSNEYELAGEGEKETPVQKCRRIQCEINELLDEISALQKEKTVTKEEQDQFVAVINVINTSKKVLDSLRLEQILGKEELGAQTDKEFKNLIEQIDEYKNTGVLTDPVQQELSLDETTRIAKLEHEVKKLEKLLCPTTETVTRLNATFGTTNLIEIVQQLTTKAALLQPNQLDIIEARMGNVLTKLDAIKEKSTGTLLENQFDQKILELYEMGKKTEPIVHLLPDILERMEALNGLHNYATNFTKVVADIESTQSSITNGVDQNKLLLKGVQSTIADNMEIMNKEIAKLDERMNKIKNK